jgi:RimJ/RimL family protein N-acetyltransferase
VTLVPVAAAQVEGTLNGELDGRVAAPGWPHADTAHGLAFARSGGWTWLVVDEHGRVAGECGVKNPPSDGVVEIGYGLAPGSRGHGLGTRAVDAMVGWILSRPEVSSVEAEVESGNVTSARLLVRLGFSIVAEAPGWTRFRRSRDR